MIFEGPKELRRNRTAPQLGNFNSRSIAWKRGSLRTEPMSRNAGEAIPVCLPRDSI
jgi:hypothetical protein